MNNLWNKTLNAGEKFSVKIGKGKLIRFSTAMEGANISALFFNSADTSEKYNMPDTLKAQHISKLSVGNILISDNGRAMLSIVSDNVGWHDAIGGFTNRVETDEKYGKTTYQENGNEYYKCGQDNFAVELVRNGLAVRDLSPCVNLFSKVYCEEDGSMNYDETNCHKDSYVILRTEMDILMIVSNTPNPIDKRSNYPSVPVLMSVANASEVMLDDICVNNSEESFRAFQNTWDYYTLAER